ncbi:MAG: Gfo/Idh/MocA family oxidoreductase [Chloroflexota bacterium]
MRLGLVGYGNGGRHFHAPYISAATGVELVGVVARAPERRAQVAADFPGLPVHGSLASLLAAGVDAVTITTPPATRRELVLEAIAGGVHVIADKPFAPTAAAGRELVDAARAAGVALSVFHNRRWDADVRTLAAVLRRGDLGELVRVESRFDLDEPGGLDPGPHGGLLRDLGAHLVDQLCWLLGPVRTVSAELEWIATPGGPTDAGFMVALVHESGVRAHASATKMNRNIERELRAYGSGGSFVSHATDAQTQAIFAGRRPAAEGDAWGYEPESAWPTLRTAAGVTTAPSERGAYQDYYTQFAAAFESRGAYPVPAEEGIRTLEVLDAARTSALEGRVVAVGAPTPPPVDAVTGD